MGLLEEGWRDTVKPEELSPYYRRRMERSLKDGCVLWGACVLIPAGILQEWLVTHPGVSCMKALIRSWSNPTKWTHFRVLSATEGVTLLHYFKNTLNSWIIFCYMVGRHHATTLSKYCNIYHIYQNNYCPQRWECPRLWRKCPRQWEKCPQQWGN